MLANLAISLVGCMVLAFVNVASFLCCLGCEARHPAVAVPVWLLLLAGAVLPLLACAFCFYFSLSLGESSGAARWRPAPAKPRGNAAPPVEPRFLGESQTLVEVPRPMPLQHPIAQTERRTTPF